MTDSTIGNVKRKRKSLLNILIVIFFVLVLILAAGFGYLYFIRINRIENILTNVTNIDVNDKSVSEAERMNLNEDIKPKPVDISKLSTTSELNSSNQTSAFNKFYITAFELQKDLTIKNVLTADQKLQIASATKNKIPVIAIISIQRETVIQNISSFAESLSTELNKNGFEGIELHQSFVILDNYKQIVEQLNENLNNNNKTLTLAFLARWGDTINYDLMDSYDLFYRINLNYNFLNDNSDEIKIYAFNFTTPRSSLIGPISPYDWVKQIIQYYVKQGIVRNKINLVINTKGYVWHDREIAETQRENYVLELTQVKYLSQEEIEAKLSQNKINLSAIYKWDDSIGEYTEEGQKYIVVYPSEQYLQKLMNLAAEYGLGAYCLN